MTRIAVPDRRIALFAAAVRVIARDGVAQASTRAIAAEADMPLASFHYVFASRDAMLLELVQAVVDEQRTEVRAAVTDADDLPGFVSGALHGWLDRAAAKPDTEVVLHELLLWSRWAPGMGDLAATIYRHYEETVLSFVTTSRERFGAVWTLPDRDVARFVLVITDGVAGRWLVDRDEPAARRMLDHGARAVLALAEASVPAVFA